MCVPEGWRPEIVKKRVLLLFILLFLTIIIIDQYFIKKGKMGMQQKQTKEGSDLVLHHSASREEQNKIIPAEEKPQEIPTVTTKEVPKMPLPQPSLTERLSELGVQIGDPVFIRIFKLSAELEIWIKVDERYELLYTYEICRQSGYLGPKLKEGDKQGPEGFYYVTKRQLNPNSKFHLAFNIGYPNAYDRAHKRTGSALMVHGNCVSIGCFAMTDTKIEEIYELVEKALENGQRIVRVHIFPFRMTRSKMDYFRLHRWYSFWKNLKEGYDYFEEKKTPPNVKVKNLKYIFE